MSRWLATETCDVAGVHTLSDVRALIVRGEFGKVLHLNTLCYTIWHEGQRSNAQTGEPEPGVYAKLLQWVSQPGPHEALGLRVHDATISATTRRPRRRSPTPTSRASCATERAHSALVL